MQLGLTELTKTCSVSRGGREGVGKGDVDFVKLEGLSSLIYVIEPLQKLWVL